VARRRAEGNYRAWRLARIYRAFLSIVNAEAFAGPFANLLADPACRPRLQTHS
jgi:hypothetical protein